MYCKNYPSSRHKAQRKEKRKERDHKKKHQTMPERRTDKEKEEHNTVQDSSRDSVRSQIGLGQLLRPCRRPGYLQHECIGVGAFDRRLHQRGDVGVGELVPSAQLRHLLLDPAGYRRIQQTGLSRQGMLRRA